MTGIICLALSSCSDQNAVSVSNPENKATTKKKVDPIQQKMDALLAMSPMDLGQMQNFLPASVDGFTQSGLTANSNMGYSTAECSYKLNKQSVQVQLIDCAGESGLGWYKGSYLEKLNNKAGGMQTINFHGEPALFEKEESLKQQTMRFISKDRILVMLSSRNMTEDELKSFAGYF